MKIVPDFNARRLLRRSDAGGRSGVSPAWLAIGGVAVLAGAALANRQAAKRTERRNPPRGAFLSVHGVRVHYVEKGEGPAVVLIHGNGVSSHDFELSGLVDRLAARHRVIVFDRPGYGYTERPRDRPWTARDQAKLFLRAMNQLGVEQAVVVGHSWGTLVSLEVALEATERVRALVLMSGYYWPTPRLDVPLLSGPAVPGFGDVLRFTVSPLLGWALSPLLFRQIFSPARIPARFKAGFKTAMSLRPSQLRASAADTAMMPIEAAKTAGRHKEITAPVLVMSGDGDKIVSFKHQSRRLARELLAGQIHVVKGAGHMIHHIAPDEVAGAITTFLEEVRVLDEAAAQPLTPSGDVRVEELA
jgi:pimeloyl-ACP methyl ester carboxylesterase